MAKKPEGLEDVMEGMMTKKSLNFLDKFFVHQCLVRRFYINNPNVYEKLTQFRGQLEHIVKKVGCPLLQSHIVYYVMNAMQNSRVIELLDNEKLTECKYFLFKMLEPIQGHLMAYEVKDLLDDTVKNELVELMSIWFTDIFDCMRKTNMFRYFNLYSSTIMINFEKLLELQKLAAQKELPLYKLMSEYSSIQTQWLNINFMPFCNENKYYFEKYDIAKICQDIYCLSTCGGVSRKYNSKNVSIIDDRVCDVVVNGEKSDGRMYLSIPYTKLPIDIDGAIRLIKNSVTGLLMDNGVYRCNTSDDDYWHSKFFTQNDSNIILLKQQNSILKLQFGMLIWDKVKIRDNTKEASIEDSSILIKENNFLHRSASAMSKDYDYVASLINQNSKTDLDSLSMFLSKTTGVVVK